MSAKIYPHAGLLVILIIKRILINFTLLFVVGWLQNNVENYYIETLGKWAGLALFLHACGSSLYNILHYCNTYIEISEDAITFRRGWIPNRTDNIFWVNIKDIDSSVSIIEGILGAGSLILTVGIKNELSRIRISYIPNHTEVSDFIRNKIGRISNNTSQVTFT
jgi:hypothetical protein